MMLMLNEVTRIWFIPKHFQCLMLQIRLGPSWRKKNICPMESPHSAQVLCESHGVQRQGLHDTSHAAHLQDVSWPKMPGLSVVIKRPFYNEQHKKKCFKHEFFFSGFLEGKFKYVTVQVGFV